LANAWPDRIRTLNSDALLARPGEALALLDEWFGIVSGETDRATVLAEVFSRNAKSGERFTADDRRANQAQAAGAHADELAKTCDWAWTVAAHAGLPRDAPLPLLS
jgi:hypothetical protein